jgi:hypothetical protein
MNENNCDICEAPCGEEFSICDTCSHEVMYYDDYKDRYVMKDGRIYEFKKGTYQWVVTVGGKDTCQN